jgi:hypothetical protein
MYNKQYNNPLVDDNPLIKNNPLVNKTKKKNKDFSKTNSNITPNDLWIKIRQLTYQYPVENQTALFLNLPEKDLNNYLKGSWPIIPKRVSTLIKNFLEYKRYFGSNVEKNFYQNFNENKMIKRLLRKRPLVFMGKGDYWHLRSGEKGMGSWDTVGTDLEQEPRTMKNYITYEEMEISTFISLSIYTPFINNGSRRNLAEPYGNHEKEGIYIGQVGCRFDEAQKMEWRFMIIDPQQNVAQFGYGPVQHQNSQNPFTYYMKMWASFYGIEHFPSYPEVQSDYSGRFIILDGYRDVYLDTYIYKRRLRMNAEVFLREADKRASVNGKKAFCHIVGLGLGAWSISHKQDILTLEMYCELLNEELFHNISDVYFAWFNFKPDEIQFHDSSKLPNQINGINIHHGQREPFEPIEDDKLLVANWAWDSASYIGNEYWDKQLSSSGDPAAACSSYIAYIGNPELNDMKRVYWY